jgi:spermidine synthase
MKYALALSCFWLSGAAGLIYEVVWIRRAALVFGATAPALSTVLAIFFGGLALGSWFGGRLAQRTARPLRVYGWLELALAAIALAATWALSATDTLYGPIYRALGGQPLLLALARPMVVTLALLPPTVVMGATLPLLCGHFVRSRGRIAGQVGALYALNTFGAAVGCAAAGFWLLPAIGGWGSALTAASLNFVAGVAMLFAAPVRQESAMPQVGAPALADTAARRDVVLAGGLFAATGLVALAVEVLWARFLALLVPNSVHTYTIALTVTLVGIVLGSGVAARIADRRENLATAFGLLLGGGAAAVLAIMHLPPNTWRALGSSTGVYLALLLPPAICSGACLPVAVRMALRDPRLAPAGVGRLVAINTVGGIVGSLLAGFVLLPWLGLAGGARVVTGFGVVAGIVALLCGGRRTGRTSGLLAGGLAAAWIAAAVLPPARVPADYLAPAAELVAWSEGQAATLAAVRRSDDVALQIDRLWQGRRGKNHQIMAAHVPMLLHPGPRRVAVIGVGVGQTASRFLMYDVDQLDCVDIEPAVFPFIAAHFGAGWLRDPRVHAFAEDGRTFIAHGQGAYDLISIEVGQTFRPGVEAFYTREFYAQARERLRDGGLIAQFVPLPFLDEPSLRRIVATFVAAMPRSVLWYNTSELLLIGGDKLALDPARLRLASSDPGLAADLAYSQWGGDTWQLHDLGALLGGFLCGPDGLTRLAAGTPLLRDDQPVLAYATAGAREEDMREIPLAAVLARYLEPVAPFLAGPVDPEVLATAARVQALNVADISSSAHRRRGEGWRAAGDLQRAITELRTALDLNPQSAEVVRVLADVYLQAQRPDIAIRLFRDALTMRPNDTSVRRGLGLALVQAGQLTEAETVLRPAVVRDPADKVAWNTLGAALAGQGKHDEAISCFERVLALDPRDQAARQNLQRARGERQGKAR